MAEYALPGNGEIRLSQIKAEFKKGNNLRDYYGVASGIPTSGTIKNTDFYGASSGQEPQGPFGDYNAGYIAYNTTDPNNIGAPQFSYKHLALSNGKGGGYPVAWGNRAGLYATDSSTIDASAVKRVCVEGNSVTASNAYSHLYLGPANGNDYRTYAGTWSLQTIDNMIENNSPASPLVKITVTIFSNQDAGLYMRSIQTSGTGFYMAVSFGFDDPPIVITGGGEE